MLKIFNGQSQSITGAALILAGATLLNKFVGIARDRVFAHYFGAGQIMDAYYASFKIPDLIYNLLVVGALTAGFIPIFTKLYEKQKEKTEAWWLASNVLNILGIGLIVLCGLGMIFTTPLARIIAPGFDTATTAMVVEITRIIFISPFLLGISMVAGGMLQSLRRFALYSLAPIFYNVGIIIGAVAFYPIFGVRGLALGVVLGAALHAGLQFYGAWEAGWRWTWTLDWRDVSTRLIGKLMIPRTLGLAISNLNIVVITMIASTLPLGSVAIFNYANNLQWVPIGIIGIPFALAVFPVLSASAAANDEKAFIKSLSDTTRKIIFFIVPLSLIFLLLRAQIVRVVLGSGKFDWTATIATADALAFFSLGLFAQALNPLFTRAFYALENTKTPFVIGVISELISIITALLLIKPLGVAGLALAASIGAIINFVLLAIYLRQITRSLEEGKILSSLFRVSIAAIAMAVVIQLLKYPLVRIFDLNYFWGVLGQGAIAGGVGLGIYLFICYILRVPEFVDLKNSLRRRWLRTANVPETAIEGVEVKE